MNIQDYKGEDCVLRSKTYEVNKVCKISIIPYILASPKYNPHPASPGAPFKRGLLVPTLFEEERL